MLFGFQEKSSSLIQKHTPAYSVVRKLFFLSNSILHKEIQLCVKMCEHIFLWK